MTVRYSHLSPEFVQDAVDRLVAPEDEAPTGIELTRELTPVPWVRSAPQQGGA